MFLLNLVGQPLCVPSHRLHRHDANTFLIESLSVVQQEKLVGS